MAKKKTFGQVEYEDVGDAYFEKRGLRRYARVWSLWALGVGAVISSYVPVLMDRQAIEKVAAARQMLRP